MRFLPSVGRSVCRLGVGEGVTILFLFLFLFYSGIRGGGKRRSGISSSLFLLVCKTFFSLRLA